MYGLLIAQPHLGRIIAGWSPWDRRPFATKKRGRIALVDLEKKEVCGFATIADVRQVSYREYLDQFGGHKMTGDPWASRRPYYEIVFRQVAKAPRPIPVGQYHDDGIWMELPDTLEEGKVQSTLFSFT